MKQKMLLAIVLAIVSMPLFAQTDGAKGKIFLSAASQNEMLVAQPDLVFKYDLETENQLICIYPEFKYQQILGIGAAFTQASAYNFSLMTPAQQQRVLELYFGETGIGLSFCRMHINACDYTQEEYVYVEDGDVELKTFSVARDKMDIIPMVQAALKVKPDIWLFASPWSPPAWMKSNNSVIQGGYLLPEYWQTWATYYARYFEEYKKEGINFFGVTVQNEAKAVQTFESCIWTGQEEGLFAANFLRPTLDKHGFDEIKIMIWDHNKERVMERARASFSVPGAKEAIWGIAHHWYSGDHFDNLRMAHELFPDKPLLATENGGGGTPVGAPNYWSGVERYAKEAIMDFNNFTSAIIAWNMILDQSGGPIHNVPRTPRPTTYFNDLTTSGGPITYNTEKKEIEVKSSYYTFGHFSKYIKRGAVRIGSSTYNDTVKAAAFCNPDGEIVIVILNTGETDGRTPKIRMNDCTADIVIPAKSLQTVVIPALGSSW